MRSSFLFWRLLIVVFLHLALLVPLSSFAQDAEYSKFEEKELSHVEYRAINIQYENSTRPRFRRIHSTVYKEHLKILKRLLSNRSILRGFDSIRLEIQFLNAIVIDSRIKEDEISTFRWRGGAEEGVLRSPWMQFSKNTNSENQQILNITVMVSDMQVIFDVYGLVKNSPTLMRHLEYQRFAQIYHEDSKYDFQSIIETITPLSNACYLALLRSYIHSVSTTRGGEVVNLYTDHPNCPTSGWKNPLLYMIKIAPKVFDWPHSVRNGVGRVVSQCVKGTTGFYEDLYKALILAGTRQLLDGGDAANEQWWRQTVATSIALEKYRENSGELCAQLK